MTEETTEVNAEVLETEAIVESPTTTEAEPEINTEVANEPEWFKGRIDKVTSQKYDAINERDTEKERADELQAQLDAINANKPKPTIEMPDEDLKYESPEEYKAKLDKYHRDIAVDALANERQAALTADKEQADKDKADQKSNAIKQSVTDSAKSFNVDIKEVDSSAVVLNQRGLKPEIAEMIVQHDASAPLITHLAKNIGDFDEINNATSVLEVVRALDSLSAKSLQRNISSAPEPVTGIEGLGAKEPNEFNKRFPSAQIKSA